MAKKENGIMIIKIGIIGIVAVLIGVMFKTAKPEYSLYIGIGAAIIITIAGISYLAQLLDEMEELQVYMEKNGSYMKLLLKMVGITYICEFVSSICRDAGYHAISNQIDVFGKICIITMGFPVVHTLFKLIGEFI